VLIGNHFTAKLIKMNGKLSTLFFLKKNKMNRKGLVPVFVRITVDGKRAEIPTNQKVTPEL